MHKRGSETLSEILGAHGSGATKAKGDLFSSSSLATAKRHETFRVEPDDGLSIPNVIIPASGDAEDFFATVATYYQDHSPVSALVHVLSEETLSLFTARHDSQRSHSVPPRSFRVACLGAAIGEATLAGVAAQESVTAVSYAACKRTLGFSLCRATLLHGLGFQPRILSQRWERLRKLTGLPVSPTTSEVILVAHAVAFGESHTPELQHIDGRLREAIRSLACGATDANHITAAVIDLYPSTRRYIDDLAGVFDGRMAAFTRMVEAIQVNSRGVRTDEIAVAFACNRILPGSFAHAAVLAKLTEFFPAALAWYGFLSALSPPSGAQPLSPSLLAKLERDLLETFSFEQRPRCDISLDEFEVIARAALRPEGINPTQQRALLVSLLPGVEVYTRLGHSDDAVSERTVHNVESDESRLRVERLLEEALYTLRRDNLPARDARVTATGRRQRKGR